MKKLLALALSLSMALALTACSKNQTPVEQPNIVSPDTTPITVEMEDDKKDEQQLAEPVEVEPQEETPPVEEEPEEEPEPEPVIETVVAGDFALPVEESILERITIMGKDDIQQFSSHEVLVMRVVETESYELGLAYNEGTDYGDGLLFEVIELDKVGYQHTATLYREDFDFFARSKDGSKYYIITLPTDMRLFRNEETYTEEMVSEWTQLTKWAESITKDFIAANDNLEAFNFSKQALKGFTYEGNHLYYQYDFSAADGYDTKAILTLSQPTGQGEGKIWCVERVSYHFGSGRDEQVDTLLVYPAGEGNYVLDTDYYAELQKRADAGESVPNLTPEGAVQAFAETSMWLFGDSYIGNFHQIDNP